MKNMFKFLLVTVFLFSTFDTLSAEGNKSMVKGKKVVTSNKGGLTYLSAAKEIKLSHSKKLSTVEKAVVNDFIRGKKLDNSKASIFESALKKHPCFVSTKKGKKGKDSALNSIPKKDAVPNWFTLDCGGKSKKTAGKKSGLTKSGSKATTPGK